ncbi:hypothetical protein Q5752_002058 [Cryptotrichosporon argae]
MPSAPIPITQQTPPHASPAISSTLSSAVSASPQTPFFQTSLFRWPSANKSPLGSPLPLPDLSAKPTSASAKNAAGAGAGAVGMGMAMGMPSAFDDEDTHGEHHDALDDDLGTMQARAYAAHASLRRAASMSQPAPPATGVFAALADSGPAGAMGAAMGDRVGRGQGVLRRLSLGGGFTRPFISPLGQSPPQPAAATSLPTPAVASAAAPAPAFVPAPAPAPPVATTDDLPPALGPKSARRRFSESGAKRRGVSPMGERILRDHAHF